MRRAREGARSKEKTIGRERGADRGADAEGGRAPSHHCTCPPGRTAPPPPSQRLFPLTRSTHSRRPRMTQSWRPRCCGARCRPRSP
eukprot:885676-Rhodomonas_salina.1